MTTTHLRDAHDETPGSGPAITLETTRFGTLHVGPSERIEVVQGLPGFPGLRELVVVPVDEHGLFAWLQACDQADVAFLAVNPFAYFPDYDVELDDTTAGTLEAAHGDELVVYSLVTVHREEGRITANLLAPIVINVTRRRANQVILVGDHPLQAPLPEVGT